MYFDVSVSDVMVSVLEFGVLSRVVLKGGYDVRRKDTMSKANGEARR